MRFMALLKGSKASGGKQDVGWDGSGMSVARLAILPGVIHYNILSSPALASTVTPFLDAPMLTARRAASTGAVSGGSRV